MVKNLPEFKGARVSRALADAGAFLTANNAEGAEFSAELLLEHVLSMERGQLFVYPDLLLRDEDALHYADFIKRRAEGCPVAYLTGLKGFWDYEFKVTPDTLIPRPETELLIESAREIFRDREASLNILDLGTGSGVILLTLLKEYPQASGLALDISTKALAVAKENAARLKVADRTHFIQSDWFATLPEEAEYDLIVANPPYVKTKAMLTLQKEVSLFEPPLALNGGADGIEPYRVITDKAHLYLKPHGWLGFETGENQHKDISAMLKIAGQYRNIRSMKDYAGHERILWAQKYGK